jgi:hypothetical protein
MGGKLGKPPCPEIVLIGNTNSGKTHFLDYLIFYGDTTKCPTIGRHVAVYEHDKTIIDLIEYGGSLASRGSWLASWETRSRQGCRALWIFVDPLRDSEQVLLLVYGYAMQMLAQLGAARICLGIVLNLHPGEKLPPKYHDYITSLYRLKQLSKQGWPVRIITLDYGNMNEWVLVVETALDWILQE